MVQGNGSKITLRMSQYIPTALISILCLGFFGNITKGAERTEFNCGWKFMRGEPTNSPALDYETVRPWLLAIGNELLPYNKQILNQSSTPMPGIGHPFIDPAFDDTTWRSVDLPHDWGIEGPFRQEYPAATGKLPWWGIGWYRKHFYIPKEDAGKLIYLEIDGAMSQALVWINGQFVGGWPYGYTSFRIDLTPHIQFGTTNVIAIRLNNPPNSSRWYPGGGIYRNVWLIKYNPIHIAPWGVHVYHTHLCTNYAELRTEVKVVNQSPQKVELRLVAEIQELGTLGPLTKPTPNTQPKKFLWIKQLGITNDIRWPVSNPLGVPLRVIQADSVKLQVDAKSSVKTNLSITIRQPLLWSVTQPNLYRLIITVEHNHCVVDVYETLFGLRNAQFTTDGFKLNGEPLKIKGVCLHHDLGALGAAVNIRAMERQLELLKSMGANAIRTSHNPPAPELLELCDRLGMLVLVEAFDCWAKGKNTNDYHIFWADWYEKDLRAMMRRDRNHPSVILWSIGNEILEQRDPDGWKLALRLVDICHQEDHTRRVTAALHTDEALTNGFQHALDVYGFNYSPHKYGQFRNANPGTPMLATETASCVSSRGEYFFPVSTNKREGCANFHVSSYDLYAPRWAYPPDVEFEAQERNPFVAGEFVWTGFDYLGEPTPYDRDTANLLHFTDPQVMGWKLAERSAIGRILVPSRSSYFGIMDTCGFPKDRYYLYRSVWRPEVPTLHILPHWNWPEYIGQPIPIHVYTSGDEVELILNGRSLGKKRKSPYTYRLVWENVTYEPGEIRAIAYKQGKLWAVSRRRTTGTPVKIIMEADRDAIWADGKDLCFVTVAVVDSRGDIVPRANHRIRFSIKGPGQIIATDNGDPTSHVSFQSHERELFNGLCLVIVRAEKNKPGTIELHAESENLTRAKIRIRSSQSLTK